MRNFAVFLFFFLLLVFLVASCNNQPETITDANDLEVIADTTATNPNDGKLAIYDLSEDDPYKLTNGEFLGLKPGASLADHKEGLRDGKLRTGGGIFDVFYIDSAEGNELGYVLPDPRDPGAIRSIVITSPNVVTEKGVRIGIEFPELMQRLGVVSISGSEVESRVYAKAGQLQYRLDMASTSLNIKSSEVPAGTKVVEIVLSN
jgi:hypothetical protein